MEGPLGYGPFGFLDVYIAEKSIMEVTEERSLKSTTQHNIVELHRKCYYCETTLTMNQEHPRYIKFVRQGHSVYRYFCDNCYVTLMHALEFGKQVTKECLADGNLGKRIYVAVERVGPQESELVNARIWPDHQLGENA